MKIRFLRKSSAPGSEAARDKLPVQTSPNFEKTVLPRAAQLPWTSGLFRKSHFMEKNTAPGSAAARDKWLVQKQVWFLRRSSAPGSAAAPDRWLVQKKSEIGEQVLPRTSGFFPKVKFLEKNKPQAAKLPGTSGFFRKNKSGKALPLAAKLLKTSGFFNKKTISWKKKLPQAAELPRTSGLFPQQKKQISGKCSARGSEAGRDKWLLPQKTNV